jgi:peptide/nickel transport system substrate-binding protein
VLSAGDVDHLDPGSAYYQFTYMVTYATQRPLYSFRPGATSVPTPDLAAGAPQVSAGGRRVTVRLRRGIRFGPPVDREVTSADVKYALERGLLPSVLNGYESTYFGSLRGFGGAAKARTGRIPGIATPDRHTVVFELTKPLAPLLVRALVLPITAPVPREYASPYDAASGSAGYGPHQVATGPYMLARYEPGRLIELVRNPSWDPRTDFRPAHVDRIVVREGNADTTLASRQILAGSASVNGDFAAPPAILKSLAGAARRRQLVSTPLGTQYVALNTAIPPFDDLDVRRAVLAGFDRRAMWLAHGGSATGVVASHFLPPGVPGFAEAGGRAGTGADFLRNPGGDLALARAYLRRAGFRSGRYRGPSILAVGDDSAAGRSEAEVAQAQLAKLGFTVKLRLVAKDTMLTMFCDVPAARVHVCPSVGWIPDFPDPYAMLNGAFNGSAIAPSNNFNWPQLDDPRVNSLLDRLAGAPGGQRAQLGGQADRAIAADAAAVPWLWSKIPNIASADVAGVVDRWNGTWDLSFTSLR